MRAIHINYAEFPSIARIFLSRLGLLSASLVLTFSVSEAAPWTYIGLRGGLSIPQLHGGGGNIWSEGYTSRLAPSFGIFFGRRFSEHFAVQLDVLYAGQGGTRDGMQPIPADALQGLPLPPGLQLYANFKNVAVLNYVEIPLMAKYLGLFGRRYRVDVGAGLYAGYLLSAKTKGSGMSSLYIDKSGTPLVIPGMDIPPLDFDSTTDVKGDIHSWNVGLTGCLDFSRGLGAGELQLDLRFTLGLVNVQRYPELNGKNNTGSLVVTLGYALRI